MNKRVLIAGVGNIFLGDDGFGVEVVKRLAQRSLPDGVEVRDFGIRGMDLAYALQDDYEVVVFVDATPRGEKPGTVSLIEAEVEDDGEVSLDAHGMDPVKVIKLSRALGAEPKRTLVVGCEPELIVGGEDYDDMVMELSEPVRAGVAEAVKLVESLVEEFREREESVPMEEGKALLVDAFDERWNAHDEEGVMGWFTEDAVVSLSPSPPDEPGAYHGKAEIRGWVRHSLPGFHVETRSHRAEGDTVVSDSTVAMDSLPVESADATVTAVFEGEKVKAMHAVFSPETVDRLRAAMEAADQKDAKQKVDR